MYGYIYETLCLTNGKKYIGQHKYNGNDIDPNYLGSGKTIAKAIKKYGKDNFSCRILEWCETKELLSLREQYYIKINDAVNSSEYYNIDNGRGNSHYYNCEEETRIKLSEQAKNRKIIHKDDLITNVKISELQEYLDDCWSLGYPPDKDRTEQYRKIAESRASNLEWKQNISKAISGRKWMTNGIKDKQVPPQDVDYYLQNGYRIGRVNGGNSKNKSQSSTTIESAAQEKNLSE